MSDDSFIREVNEEMRQDQARALWDRFGPFLIGAAIVVVLGTAGWVGYDYWRTKTANASGDRFSQALTLANEGKSDEAIAALEALEADGYGAYPLLARMRAANVLDANGELVAQADAGLASLAFSCQRAQIDVSALTPGAYTLTAIVYRWQDGARLLGTDVAGGATGERLTIGQFQVD